MRGRTTWIPFGFALALILGGCGGEEVEPPEAAAQREEAARQEREAARRQEEKGELEQRLAALRQEVSELRAGAGELPAELGDTVGALEQRLSDPERLLGELEAAGAEGWEQARGRLESAIQEARGAYQQAASQASDWQARQQAALEVRDQAGHPIDERTGLLAGLDGGEYPLYKVSAVERVQRRLREQGLYAGPVDGVFCRPTLEAVGRFQESAGLHVSGVPSPMTRERLFGDAG